MNSKDVRQVAIHLSTKKLLDEIREFEYQTYDSNIRHLIKDSNELKELKTKIDVSLLLKKKAVALKDSNGK